MKTPHDEPKTTEVNSSDLKKKDTSNTSQQPPKKSKYKIHAWNIFVLMLFAVAVYEYFTLEKRLNNSSGTVLIVFIISLVIIIKIIRKINECKEDAFLIRTFKAKGILLKVKKLAQWLDTITFWQRNVIFFAVFILGYLIMIK